MISASRINKHSSCRILCADKETMDLWCNAKVVDFEVRVHTRIFQLIVHEYTEEDTRLFRLVWIQESVEEDMSMNMEFLLLDSYKGRIRMSLENSPPTPCTPPAKDEPLSAASAKRGSNGDGNGDACAKGKDKEHASAQHHPTAVHPTVYPTGHQQAGPSAGNSSGHAAGHAGRRSPEKCEDHKAGSQKLPAGGAPSKSADGDEDDDCDGNSPFPREFASRLCAVLTIDGVKIPPVEPK